MEYNNDTYFAIRAYWKYELALAYFPTAKSKHVAVNHLMSWINRCTPLKDALVQVGYSRTCKLFTPKEVALIVEYLGDP